MFPRAPALLLCLVLSALVMKRALAHRADVWGQEWGNLAAELLPALVPRPVVANEAALQDSFARLAEEERALAAAPPREEPATPTKGRHGKQVKPKAAKGVFVPAASVLRLANAAVMPRAAFAPALGARPAGLRLIGVSGLGIGMRDGDVLTRVMGAGVGSVGEVVQRVIAARNQHAREISGEFWRDGAPWSLVVEQPYLDAPSSAPAPR